MSSRKYVVNKFSFLHIEMRDIPCGRVNVSFFLRGAENYQFFTRDTFSMPHPLVFLNFNLRVHLKYEEKSVISSLSYYNQAE